MPLDWAFPVIFWDCIFGVEIWRRFFFELFSTSLQSDIWLSSGFFLPIQIVLWLLIYKWAHLMWFEKRYYYYIFSTLRNEESITLMALISCKSVTVQTWQRLGSRKEMISKDNSEAYFLLGKRSHQCILAHTCIFSILSSYFCFMCL